MSLRADVTKAQHRVFVQLALDGNKIVLVVRIGVSGRRRGHSRQGKKWREIDTRVWMVCGSIERRKRQRKRLAVHRAIRGRDKWGGKQRRPRTGVAKAVRGLRLVDGDGVAFDHGI